MGATKHAAIRMQSGHVVSTSSRPRSRHVVESKVPPNVPSPVVPAPAQLSRHTPRRIRTRVNLAQRPRKSESSGPHAISDELPVEKQSNSSVARNNSTGRLAMGPWLGSFGCLEDPGAYPNSRAVYLDPKGMAYFELVHRNDGGAAFSDMPTSVVSDEHAAQDLRMMHCSQAQQVSELKQRPCRRPFPGKAAVGSWASAKGRRSSGVKRFSNLMQPRQGF